MDEHDSLGDVCKLRRRRVTKMKFELLKNHVLPHGLSELYSRIRGRCHCIHYVIYLLSYTPFNLDVSPMSLKLQSRVHKGVTRSAEPMQCYLHTYWWCRKIKREEDTLFERLRERRKVEMGRLRYKDLEWYILIFDDVQRYVQIYSDIDKVIGWNIHWRRWK